MTKIRLLRRLLVFVLLFLFVLNAGCSRSPATGKVSGVITVDGAALEGVVVSFCPEHNARPASGVTNEEGKYTIQFTRNRKGCIPGPNTVRISAYKTVPGVGSDEEQQQYLPARYNISAQNNPDMAVEVKQGNNTFNFNVLSK